MKRLLFLLAVLPSFMMAQEKIGNKIYKYGDLYHSIEGNTLISFEEADAKSMSKTIEYFRKQGARVQSWTSLFLPGTEVSEEEFIGILNDNNIQTLILFDVIDSSSASMSRTTNTAYASVNNKRENSRTSNNKGWSGTYKANSRSSSVSSSTTRNVDYTTEMSLRLTIFSKKDEFSAPVAVVEGRATNQSPDTTAEQIARRIVRRMAKALEEQRAF